MRLLFVADLHYSLKQFDWLLSRAGDFDVAIIGGDLLDLGSPLDPDVQIVIVERYLRQIRERARLVVSSGNHDGDGRNVADETVAEWIRAARTDGVHVDGDGVDLDGFRFTVCPWWDGPVARAETEALLAAEAALPNRRWIWIHHAPPLGSRTSWTGRKDAGDDVLRGWIERYQPEMVLSGHIHHSPFYEAGSWIDRIGRTWVFNPGRQPGAQPTSIVIDLGEMTAVWRSAEGSSFRELRTADD